MKEHLLHLKYELRQNYRLRVRTVLIIALLLIISFFVNIQSSIWIYSTKELKQAKSAYKTFGALQSIDDMEHPMSTDYAYLNEDMLNKIEHSNYFIGEDKRRLLTGIAESYNRDWVFGVKGQQAFIYGKVVGFNKDRAKIAILNDYQGRIKDKEIIIESGESCFTGKLNDGEEYYLRLEQEGAKYTLYQFVTKDNQAEIDRFMSRYDDYYKGYVSYTLIFTSSIESCMSFYDKLYEIEYGKFFNNTEENEGDVCIISHEFATLNHLEIGDTISFVPKDEFGGYNSIPIGLIYNWEKDDKWLSGEELTYSVIGIYQPAYNEKDMRYFEHETTYINPYTIFIPKHSLPNEFASEQNFIHPALYSFQIKTGYEKEFLEELKENDFPFEHYVMEINDGGYQKVAKVLDSMRISSRNMLIISILGMLLLLSVVTYFYLSNGEKSYHVLHRIGISKKQIQTSIVTGITLIASGGILLGGILGGMTASKLIHSSYKKIANQLAEEEFTVDTNIQDFIGGQSFSIEAYYFICITLCILLVLLAFIRIGLGIMEGKRESIRTSNDSKK